MDEIWALVLAAGESRRMGTQKLLLPWAGKPVVACVVDNILSAGISRIMVVLGSHSQEIQKALESYPVNLIRNPCFQEGMFSSVLCGLEALPATARAFLIFLGDQTEIPGEVTRALYKAWKNSGKGIIIPVYGGKRGHPALVDMKFLQEIRNLDPGTGLRSLAARFPADVLEIPSGSPQILVDIDTPRDYLDGIKSIISNDYGRKDKI